MPARRPRRRRRPKQGAGPLCAHRVDLREFCPWCHPEPPGPWRRAVRLPLTLHVQLPTVAVCVRPACSAPCGDWHLGLSAALR